MNELFNDFRFWFVTVGAAAVGIVKYLWTKQERRLEKLEADAVRRTEFDQFRSDMREEHQENIGRLDDIKTEITGTNKRLDELMMRGLRGDR